MTRAQLSEERKIISLDFQSPSEVIVFPNNFADFQMRKFVISIEGFSQIYSSEFPCRKLAQWMGIYPRNFGEAAKFPEWTFQLFTLYEFETENEYRYKIYLEIPSFERGCYARFLAFSDYALTKFAINNCLSPLGMWFSHRDLSRIGGYFFEKFIDFQDYCEHESTLRDESFYWEREDILRVETVRRCEFCPFEEEITDYFKRVNDHSELSLK